LAPALRVAAQIRPYFVVGLDLGATKAFGLRLVSYPIDEDLSVGTPIWPDFRERGPQRAIFCTLGMNATGAKVNNRL
jgi:hypothetical protein